MNISKAFLMLISSILFMGCEGYKILSGTVVSSESGKPIQGAEIKILNNIASDTYTDSSGEFKTMSHFIGMTFGGPKFKFEIKKEGFESQVVKAKFSADTVRLIPNGTAP